MINLLSHDSPHHNPLLHHLDGHRLGGHLFAPGVPPRRRGVARLLPAAKGAEDLCLGAYDEPPAHGGIGRGHSDGGRHPARLQEVYEQEDTQGTGGGRA